MLHAGWDVVLGRRLVLELEVGIFMTLLIGNYIIAEQEVRFVFVCYFDREDLTFSP